MAYYNHARTANNNPQTLDPVPPIVRGKKHGINHQKIVKIRSSTLALKA
jgi:hypothetical protein